MDIPKDQVIAEVHDLEQRVQRLTEEFVGAVRREIQAVKDRVHQHRPAQPAPAPEPAPTAPDQGQQPTPPNPAP